MFSFHVSSNGKSFNKNLFKSSNPSESISFLGNLNSDLTSKQKMVWCFGRKVFSGRIWSISLIAQEAYGEYCQGIVIWCDMRWGARLARYSMCQHSTMIFVKFKICMSITYCVFSTRLANVLYSVSTRSVRFFPDELLFQRWFARFLKQYFLQVNFNFRDNFLFFLTLIMFQSKIRSTHLLQNKSYSNPFLAYQTHEFYGFLQFFSTAGWLGCI